MKTRLSGTFFALGLAASWGAGCDTGASTTPPPPEVEIGAIATELDAVVCELSFDCECTYGRSFSERQECTAWATAEQAEAQRLMDEHGLLWDPTCLGWYVQAFEQLECAGYGLFPTDPDGDGCSAACAPLHGTRAQGESCADFERGLSDCDVGLRCAAGTCVALCPSPADRGEACRDRPCAQDLYCDYGQDEPVCRPKADAGEACDQIECVTGLRCVVDSNDPTSVRCEALAKADQACMGHSECESGYCPAGYCAPVPGLGGDCRGTGVCADGLFCVEDTCGPAKDRGDSCTTGCGGGLECIDGTCVGANAAACWPNSPFTG